MGQRKIDTQLMIPLISRSILCLVQMEAASPVWCVQFVLVWPAIPVYLKCALVIHASTGKLVADTLIETI